MIPQNETPPATLRDIAKKHGVSHTTVSLALKGSPRVTAALRKAIGKTAEKLNYKPNAMARALVAHRRDKKVVSAELAWINCWNPASKLRSFKELNMYWEGAHQAADENGFRLEEFRCNDQNSPKLEKVLLARNIRGILIPPHRIRSDKVWQQIDWSKFCTVRFGFTLAHPPVDIVTSDQLASGILAFENITRLGYKRVGFVTGLAPTNFFTAGFLFKQQYVEKENRIPIFHGRFPANPEDQQAIHKWIKEYRPDAILSDVSEIYVLIKSLG